MAKMSAARKRHPEITVSLSMSVGTGGGPSVRVPRCHLEGGGTFRSQSTTPPPLVPSPPAALRYGNPRWSWWRGQFDPRFVRTSCLMRSAGSDYSLAIVPSLDRPAGAHPARGERIAARLLVDHEFIPVTLGGKRVQNVGKSFAFNRWWILEQWTRTHACSPLISWVCSLSLSSYESFFFPLKENASPAHTEPLLWSTELHIHIRNNSIKPLWKASELAASAFSARRCCPLPATGTKNSARSRLHVCCGKLSRENPSIADAPSASPCILNELLRGFYNMMLWVKTKYL